MAESRSVWGAFLRRMRGSAPAPSEAGPQPPDPAPLPCDAAGWQAEGQRCAGLARWEEAVACLERALELDPRCAGAWHQKARCLGALGRLEEAIECYERVVSLDPQMADAWVGKALAEERIGRVHEAARSYEAYVAVAPAQDAAQIAYARRRVRELGLGREAKAESPRAAETGQPAPLIPRRPPAAAASGVHRQGDRIAEGIHVLEVLGSGGFGTVYLAELRETKQAVTALPFQVVFSTKFALKTFRDEYLANPLVRLRFRREAQILVDLGRHPYLLHCHGLYEIAGRLYIATEYIAPNAEGLNSLEGYLRHQPPDLAQSLRWAIQVCYGMEYAHEKGLRCHRDLKPANILIKRDSLTQDRTVRIADFGLAGVLEQAHLAHGVQVYAGDGHVRLSAQSVDGAGFGTPTHMPPEQFTTAASCDERSDIYAFGVVLFQMASAGQLPFLAALPRDPTPAEMARFWREMRQLHTAADIPRLNSPLFPVIERCLAKKPGGRYVGFRDLRGELESLLLRHTGEVAEPPAVHGLSALDWCIRGSCLAVLGRAEEAVACYDRALAVSPQFGAAWSGRGLCLANQGHPEEALACLDRALSLDPQSAALWHNKAKLLYERGRIQESVACFDRALAINPQDATGSLGRGLCLAKLGRPQEALACYDRAAILAPGLAAPWRHKALCLHELGRCKEAATCYDRALALEPHIAPNWYNKGLCLGKLGRRQEAIACFDRALALDPRMTPALRGREAHLRSLGRREEALACCDQALALNARDLVSWNNKGVNLSELGRREEAIACYDRVLAIEPEDPVAWHNKAANLYALRRWKEAIACYDRALALGLRSARAWLYKAVSEDQVGRRQDAAHSYEQFLMVASDADEQWIPHARQRLRALQGGEH